MASVARGVPDVEGGGEALISTTPEWADLVAHKAEIDAIKANASKDLDESTVKVTDMLTLVKTLMKDKGIESAKVDEEGSGTEATAVNLRNRLMSLTSDLQEQSTRWK